MDQGGGSRSFHNAMLSGHLPRWPEGEFNEERLHWYYLSRKRRDPLGQAEPVHCGSLAPCSAPSHQPSSAANPYGSLEIYEEGPRAAPLVPGMRFAARVPSILQMEAGKS